MDIILCLSLYKLWDYSRNGVLKMQFLADWCFFQNMGIHFKESLFHIDFSLCCLLDHFKTVCPEQPAVWHSGWSIWLIEGQTWESAHRRLQLFEPIEGSSCLSPSKGSSCFLWRETLFSLFCTGWFQEWIQAWFIKPMVNKLHHYVTFTSINAFSLIEYFCVNQNNKKKNTEYYSL